MSFFNEYGLLLAVALPVATILGMQLFLYLGGERGTLLLPGIASYPSIELGARPAETNAIPMPAASPAMSVCESSNDEMVREAA